MYGRNKLLITTFILAGFLSAFGLYRLFALRFERGDMFPAYSSLRSDPLGCKALFISLERMPGLAAARNFRDPDKLKGAQGRTIYYLGAGEALLGVAADKQAEKLEALAKGGDRLVIALAPDKARSSAAKAEDISGDDDDEEDEPKDKDEEKDQPRAEEAGSEQSSESRAGRWGIETGSFDPPVRQGKDRPQALVAASAPELSPTLPLHSRRWFQADYEEWRPVYSYGERTVVLERRIGKGSIVLMADAYLLSNEAMRNDRFPGLLAWLQGTNRAALFDESHLGISESPGVMSLIRKHRLIPFLIALMALAALYVWKSAVPFVNTHAPEKEPRDVALRDNFSGLVNLLRRNIAPAELLETCFREWSKSFAREIKHTPDLAQQVKAIVAAEAARPSGKRDPLRRYREIQRRLKAEG